MFARSRQRETFKALDRALQDACRVEGFRIEKDRFVVFSDVHKGDGESGSDDFLHNSNLYRYVLQYYFDHFYALILNGDCEDCWETDPQDIVRAYRRTAFAAERQFNAENRYFRTVGNHDDDWKDPAKVDRYLGPVLGPVRVWPSVLLGDRILVLHGHQGDRYDGGAVQRSRWIVHFIWAPLQRRGLTDFLWPVLRLFGFVDTGRAAQNNFIRRERDRLLYEWAKARRMLVIAGHTHRGMFRSFSKIDQIRAVRTALKRKAGTAVTPKERLLISLSIDYLDRVIHDSREELKRDKTQNRLADDPVPCYFNDGCCVHTNGITGIEIDRGEIRLVKWELSDAYHDREDAFRRDPELFATVQRRIYESGNLAEILRQIKAGEGVSKRRNGGE